MASFSIARIREALTRAHTAKSEARVAHRGPTARINRVKSALGRIRAKHPSAFPGHITEKTHRAKGKAERIIGRITGNRPISGKLSPRARMEAALGRIAEFGHARTGPWAKGRWGKIGTRSHARQMRVTKAALRDRVATISGRLRPRAKMSAALERLEGAFAKHHLRPHYRGARETLAGSLKALRRRSGSGPRILTKENRRKALSGILRKQRAQGAGPLSRAYRAHLSAALERLAEFGSVMYPRQLTGGSERVKKLRSLVASRMRAMRRGSTSNPTVRDTARRYGRSLERRGFSALERLAGAFGMTPEQARKSARRAAVRDRLGAASKARKSGDKDQARRHLAAARDIRAGGRSLLRGKMSAALERLEGTFARSKGNPGVLHRNISRDLREGSREGLKRRHYIKGHSRKRLVRVLGKLKQHGFEAAGR